MPRISANGNVVAQDSQTLVQIVAMHRVDSHGNLSPLDRVANRQAALVSVRPRPSAPPAGHGSFRRDFAGSHSSGRAPLSGPVRDVRPVSADIATQTDGAWEAPPPYSALAYGAPLRANAL